MERRNQRGAVSFGTIVTLALIAGAIYAGVNLIPPYVANYTLKDKMIELARIRTTDDKILDTLMTTVRENGLEGYVTRQTFRIVTSDTSRRISCSYERELKVLPGFTRRFSFVNDVDQPYF